jgi:hypothetical protein
MRCLQRDGKEAAMTGSYRISFMRSSGWTRLGLAGAVAAVFATPMLWALGAFGTGDDALHRAVVFVAAALWFFTATCYVIGWALKGFMVRLKDPDDEGDEPSRHPSHASPPSASANRGPAAPAHRPGH